MATWSITSSGGTDLVSIDSTGKLTYSAHTADTQYTISYVGDDGCTASKDITIKKCEGPQPYYLSTKFVFNVSTSGLTDIVYQSLRMQMTIKDTETSEVMSSQLLGMPHECSCTGDCPEGLLTSTSCTYDVTSILTKPLSAYTVTITPSVIIGRNIEGTKCSYTWKGWFETEVFTPVVPPGPPVPTTSPLEATLDKVAEHNTLYIPTWFWE